MASNLSCYDFILDIYNLPFDITWKTIEDSTDSEVRYDDYKIHYNDPKKARAVARLYFGDEEAFEEAQSIFTRTEINGRKLFVVKKSETLPKAENRDHYLDEAELLLSPSKQDFLESQDKKELKGIMKRSDSKVRVPKKVQFRLQDEIRIFQRDSD